jgi:RHS repeat-associated protein
VRQVFDAEGRVVQIGYPEGQSVHYGYSARGEVTSVRDPALAALSTTSSDWQLAYDPLGRPVRERNPFGHERRTAYTPEGFVEQVEIHSATALVESYAYAAYDELGNPGQIVTGEGTTALQYDPRSRLEKVAYPGGSLAACLTSCERFQYDLAGNRTVHVQNGIEARYVVDADDRLVEIEDAQGQTLATFSHDAAGRRTGRSDASAETTYGYDALGRLRTYQVGAFYGSLAYTATDERTARTDFAGTTRYLGEWYETAPSEQRRLVHGPGIDNVLGQVSTTSQVRTLWRDGTRNVARTPLDANTGGLRRYEAFGAIRTGSSPVERGFAGRPVEGLSGLINVRARHYDEATGRFLQPDPLGVAADQLYAYAANDPYRLWDPEGRRPRSLTEEASSLVSQQLSETLSTAYLQAGAASIGGSPREIVRAVEFAYGSIDLLVSTSALTKDPILHGLARGTAVLNIGIAAIQFAHVETPGDYTSAFIAAGLGIAGLTATAAAAPWVLAAAGTYLVADSVLDGGVAGLIDRGISAFLNPVYGNNIHFYYDHPRAMSWYYETYR